MTIHNDITDPVPGDVRAALIDILKQELAWLMDDDEPYRFKDAIHLSNDVIVIVDPPDDGEMLITV